MIKTINITQLINLYLIRVKYGMILYTLAILNDVQKTQECSPNT